MIELLLRINNLAIEGKPDDLVINTHVCRGNFHSTWASSGAYDRVAEFLFARGNVSAYYLDLMMNVLAALNLFGMSLEIKRLS